MEHDLLIGTRVFGELDQSKLEKVVLPFIQEASHYGQVLTVTESHYPLREHLGGDIKCVPDKSPDSLSFSHMCNVIWQEARKRHLPYFALVSSDLSVGLKTLPRMKQEIDKDEQVAFVGLQVEGIHDLSGNNLTVDNYFRLLHNNAFCLRRTHITNKQGIILPDRRQVYSRLTDNGMFGKLPSGLVIGGNEDVFHYLSLVAEGFDPKIVILSGSHSIVRDSGKETTNAEKMQRREQVVKFYQHKVIGLDDNKLQDWLSNSVMFVT